MINRDLNRSDSDFCRMKKYLALYISKIESLINGQRCRALPDEWQADIVKVYSMTVIRYDVKGKA